MKAFLTNTNERKFSSRERESNEASLCAQRGARKLLRLLSRLNLYNCLVEREGEKQPGEGWENFFNIIILVHNNFLVWSDIISLRGETALAPRREAFPRLEIFPCMLLHRETALLSSVFKQTQRKAIKIRRTKEWSVEPSMINNHMALMPLIVVIFQRTLFRLDSCFARWNARTLTAPS